MKVALDARALDRAGVRRSGIGRYVQGLLGELPVVARERGGELVVLRDLPRPPVPERLSELPEQLLLRRDVRGTRADVLHVPSPYGTALRPGVPFVVTLHDLAPLLWPDRHLKTGLRHRLLYRAVRRADAVVVPSRATRDDALRLLELDRERVAVVPEGVASSFAPADPAAAHARLGERYIAYLGRLDDPRKAVEELVTEFSRWARSRRRRETLVLAGEPRSEGERLAALADGARVLATGFVPDEELPALLSGARCLVTASRHEGFGLPALEALACGTPVAAYEVGALPEAAGPGALLAPAGRPSELMAAVERLCDDDELRTRLAHAGRRHAAAFSWRRCAEATWDVYEIAA